MREEKTVRFDWTRTCLMLLSVAAALAVAGCSHTRTNVYQGYVEGRFVYVASPESGRLDHLSVTRGETIATGHPLFALDTEPEASEEREAEAGTAQLGVEAGRPAHGQTARKRSR